MVASLETASSTRGVVSNPKRRPNRGVVAVRHDGTRREQRVANERVANERVANERVANNASRTNAHTPRVKTRGYTERSPPDGGLGIDVQICARHSRHEVWRSS